MARILALIPARHRSSRFPGKPLARLGGKSVVQRVHDNVGRGAVEACVVTDDDLVEAHLRKAGAAVRRVNDAVPTGTDRAHLAFRRFFADGGWDLVVNVQGDEPFVTAADVEALADFHRAGGFEVSTLVRRVRDEEEFYETDSVKVALTKGTGECHYFSRGAIPCGTDGHWEHALIHLGVYCFRPADLERFCGMGESRLERMEKLEQLRAIENGMRIGALAIDRECVAVNSKDDLEKAQRILDGQA